MHGADVAQTSNVICAQSGLVVYCPLTNFVVVIIIVIISDVCRQIVRK